MEIKVEFFKPDQMFGWSAYIWRTNIDGKRVVLHFDELGNQKWDEVISNVQTLPTLHMDDQLWEAVARAWNTSFPPPEPDPKAAGITQMALTDAIAVRDRLLTLLEASLMSAGAANETHLNGA